MITTFGSIYHEHQYMLDTPTLRNLGEVVSGASTTVRVYNASSYEVSAPVTVPLEDGTFFIVWPGQTFLSTAANLASNELSVPAFSSVEVKLEFLKPVSVQLQAVKLGWAGSSIDLEFKRFFLVNQKPEGNVIEELEYKTHISEAWDGMEQRTRLRSNPRTKTTYQYLVGSRDRSNGREFQAQMMGLTSRTAKVAKWHRSQTALVSGTPGGEFADDFWNLELNGPDIWDPSITALKKGDIVLYEDVEGEIHTQNMLFDGTVSDKLWFTSLPGTSLGDSVTLVPQDVAILQENPAVKVYPSDAVGYKATWVSQQAEYVGNLFDSSTYYSALAPELNSTRPILREGNLVKRSLKFSGDSGAITFDRKIGAIETFHRRESNTISFDRQFEYTNDPGKIDALRKFLMWTQGRQRSFYVPSGTADLVVVSSVGNCCVVAGTDLGGVIPLLDGYADIESTDQDGNKTQHHIEYTKINPNGTVSLIHSDPIAPVAYYNRPVPSPRETRNPFAIGNYLPVSTSVPGAVHQDLSGTADLTSINDLNPGARFYGDVRLRSATLAAQLARGDYFTITNLDSNAPAQYCICTTQIAPFEYTYFTSVNRDDLAFDAEFMGENVRISITMENTVVTPGEDLSYPPDLINEFPPIQPPDTIVNGIRIPWVPTVAELTATPVAPRVELLYHVRLASDRVKLQFDGRESVKCKLKVQTVKQ